MPSDIKKDDSNYTKAYKLAKAYLTQDFTKLEGLAATAFELVITYKPATIPAVIENTATAFANRITAML